MMELNDYMKIDDKMKRKYKIYMDLLIEWNKKINLTAITEKNEIILKHFVDSLTIKDLIMDEASVIDVGTGAGFPGIPLKIYNDTIKVTLLDSLNKRINFLNEVINKLELKNTTAIHGRAEDIARLSDYREKYDVVTSRAVANMSTLLEYMMPFAKVGGLCICMKGSNIEEELNNSKKAIKELGGKLSKIEEFTLPDSDIKRNIVVIEKIKPISKKYPRKAGIPSKNPL